MKEKSIEELLTQLQITLEEHRIAGAKYEALANQEKDARKVAEFYWMVQSHRAAIRGCLEDIEKLLILARSMRRNSSINNALRAEPSSTAAKHESGRTTVPPVEAA